MMSVKALRIRQVRWSVAPVVCAVALLLASCVSLDKGYPERRFFVLDAGAAPEPTTPNASNAPGAEGDATSPGMPGETGAAGPAGPAGTVLKVRPFGASDAWSGQEFTYRTDTATWETDYYNTFLIPPAVMISDQARQVMSTEGVAGTVVAGGSYVEPTHLLEGHVINISADFRDRAAPHAVLEMQLFLIEVQRGIGTVRLQKNYQQRVPIDVGDYADKTLGEGIVAGWNTALRRILTDFARAIRDGGAISAPPGG